MADRRKSSVVSVTRANDGILRLNDEQVRRMSVKVPEIAAINHEAKHATRREHDMTVLDAVRLYPKAVMFSLAFSTAVIMEGYDLSLIGSFFGFPQFKARFGTEPDPANPGQLVIGAKWQTSIQNGVQVGSIIGLYLNGWISDKIGYRKTMIGSLLLMIAFTFIPFFSPSIEVFVVGAVLQGIPWGVFQTLTVTYASEVSPTKLRPILTTYVNLCWVMGQLIAAGVLRGVLNLQSEWAYRIPFAIQWVWPVVILPFAIMAPESPWWLVRKGRDADARAALLSLTNPKADFDFNVDDQVSLLRTTNEMEMALAASTSYLQCFKGVDRRRTEISSMVWIAQAFCGGALMGYSVQFYQAAGLPDDQVFNLNIGQYAMGAVGTVASWFIMPYVGRRKIYTYGLCALFVLLMAVGFAGIPDRISNGNNIGASWAIGSLLLIYTFVYDFTVGPVCYSLVAEIPSTRLKIKTVVLARNFYNIGGIINNTIMPRMLLSSEWNLGAFTGFFWAGVNALLITWCYFRLPEPKDRTYAELDTLFEKGVSARKFHKTKVDATGGGETTDFASVGGSDDVSEDGGVDNEKKGGAQHVEHMVR